jgi:TrwC relaxase
VAVVATLSKGYDLDYVWRQAGPAARKSAADYYIQASEHGGEPPGRWWGPGAAALGFGQGQVVEREPYNLLFGERKGADGTQLGRPPGGGREAAAIFQQLLKAEPHATAERRRELRVEAAARAQRSPLYFDLTISLSKSISIFCASLGENARLARLAGDRDNEAYWAGLVGEMDAMIWAPVYAGFAYFQREAGYTRTGSHAHRVGGRETGQWHEAGLAVAHWLQHTSRDGDMQLHVHSQIAHVARTTADGKWRAPDSYGYTEHVGAVAAIVSQHLEEALTARFGVAWVPREDGHGLEIKGISGAMMRLFSTRRESITADLRERAREFASRYARAPSQRELAQLAQASNFATRPRKDAQALDFDELHAGWAARLASRLGVSLASVAPSARGERGSANTGRAGSPGEPGTGRRLSPLDVRRAAQTALALAQRDKTTFTRADLIKYLGRVMPRTGMDSGEAVRLLQDLAGDLLACTRNDHTIQAGEPGRALANGDLLRVDAVTPRGLLVRRATGTDPETGLLQWTDRRFLYSNFADCELGYAVTEHAAQSRTVDTGLVLITGTEDRQHAYMALTRGWRSNMAFVLTVSPKIADPAPGPRTAPEIARYDRLQALRAGQPGPDTQAAEANTAALEVLASIVARDGQELSATQTLQQNLADADHLAILHAIWTGETTPARDQRYRDLLAAALPAQYAGDISHRARWLWQTLRSAELAGLDPAGVLRDAVGQRSLSDVRDAAAVVDARIRQRIRGLVPRGARPWSAQVPAMGDPERQDYVARIAQLMDERKERIGEHAAEHGLGWAVRALGPVPADPLDRLDWQRRASSVGAYRELYGYQHPAEPIGPEPAGDSPDKRAAWHEAFAALGTAGDAQVRGMPDGLLLHLRDTYPAETAWAPAWVGDELRQVRRGAQEARLAAIRAQAEAAAARRDRHEATANRHDALAASYRAMAAAYGEREKVFAGVMADRRAWEQATAGKRRLAVAADAELRRRHPGQRFTPLRSAEPEPASETQRGALVLAAGESIPPLDPWIQKLAAGRELFTDQLAEQQNQEPASPGPGDTGAVPGSASWPRADREPLLQPPKPLIPPSARVLQRAGQRAAGMEAAT